MKQGCAREEDDLGVKVHRVPSPFGIYAFRRLRRLLDRSDNWVVHAHSTAGFFLAPTKFSWPCPIFAHVHGLSERLLPKYMGYPGGKASGRSLQPGIQHAREKLAWSSADRVLSLCNFLSSGLARYYGINPQSITNVYNGVDEGLFHLQESTATPYPELAGKKIVLYAGRFGPRKGTVDLIRAMKHVVSEVQDAHLLCVGGVPKWLEEDDYWAVLRQEVESNGLTGKVSLMNAIPNERLVSVYSSAAVLACPSYYDAFPKVILEAMACSKPVVGTNMGGIPEMIEDGKNGLLVEYGSVERLAAAICQLLGDEKKSREMGRVNRARVEEMFTWTKVVERIGKVYLGASPRIAPSPIVPAETAVLNRKSR
jgi:glycosyltransferase involved in cell wall biosynthesis